MLRLRSGLCRTALTTAFAACALAAAPAAHGSGSGCSRVASPAGSDSWAGSEQAPYRSAQQLADSLAPGETGCLRAGTYTEDVRVNHGQITLRDYPGERATVIGRFLVPEGSDGVTVEGLHLDGTNSEELPSPTVNARDVAFRRNDVTNNHTAICFSLGHPSYGRAVRTTIELNRIHDCGRLPASNHDHGIYITWALDAAIRNNWIYDNADRGIQLYPDAQHTTITGNVIDGNGQGIIFSGYGDTASNDNLVEGNVITNSKIRHNVESYYPDGTPTGKRNTVRHNCIKGGARDTGTGGIATPQVGFSAADNVVSDPGYANRPAKDFRLSTDSGCRGLVQSASVVPGPELGGVPPAPGGSRPAPAGSRPAGPAPVPSAPGTGRRTPARPGPQAGRPEAKRPKARPEPKHRTRLFVRVSLAARAVRASTSRSKIRLVARGRLFGARSPHAHRVRIAVLVGGRWKTVGWARMDRGGRFKLVRSLRLPRGERTVRLRASTSGQSAVVVAARAV